MKVQQELTKLYYSIGEVAEMFGVSNSLIRYWETEFTRLKPKKNRKGDRRYTIKEIRYLERIYTLVKERGFTLDGAKKELSRKATGTDQSTTSNPQLVSKLKSVLQRLESIQDKL